MNLGVVFGMVPRYEIYLQFYFIHDCMKCSFAACEPAVLNCQLLSGHKQNRKTHRNSRPTMEILLGAANG